MSTITPSSAAALSGSDLARYIDHTVLKPEAAESQIIQLCEEARRYQFMAVCVNPVWVKRCAQLLQGSSTRVATVAGFPLGATLPEVKAYEAQQVVDAGAHEVDMVINVGALKSKDYALVSARHRRSGAGGPIGWRDHQSDYRSGAIGRRRKNPRVPVGGRSGRGIRQDLDRLCQQRRDRARCRLDASDRRAAGRR